MKPFGSAIVLGLCAVLAGCGGPVNTTPVTSPPAVLPSQSVSSTGAYVYQLPASGAFSGELGVPSSSNVLGAGAIVTLSEQTTAPSGVPALSAARAAAAATRNAMLSGATITPSAFLTLSWSQNVTLTNGLAFVYAPPSGTIVAGETYYAAFYDPTSSAGWQLAVAGPTTTDGVTVTFPFPALAYAANKSYIAGLYTVATPAGPIALSSTSVSLLGTGATNAKSVTVSETAYTGNFAIAASTCANIASVTPANGAGPSLALTITGIAAGTCSATVTDGFAQSAQLAITVTTSGINAN